MLESSHCLYLQSVLRIDLTMRASVGSLAIKNMLTEYSLLFNNTTSTAHVHLCNLRLRQSPQKRAT